MTRSKERTPLDWECPGDYFLELWAAGFGQLMLPDQVSGCCLWSQAYLATIRKWLCTLFVVFPPGEWTERAQAFLGRHSHRNFDKKKKFNLCWKANKFWKSCHTSQTTVSWILPYFEDNSNGETNTSYFWRVRLQKMRHLVKVSKSLLILFWMDLTFLLYICKAFRSSQKVGKTFNSLTFIII